MIETAGPRTAAASEPTCSRRRVSRVLARVLLAVALLLFLCSMLVWVSAPTSWLWLAAILISECGHFAVVPALVGAAVAWRFGHRVTALLALGVALNGISPAARALLVAKTLPTDCAAAFGTVGLANGVREQPISFAQLFAGIPTAETEVTELTYAMNGTEPLKLDLYQATDAIEPQPLVMMVHGGSWNRGGKEELAAMNRILASRHYAVAAINYRRAPKQPFPAAVEDVFRALEFLKSHAAEARLDMTRIALIGRSAGGQIALSAAYSGQIAGLRGVVSFYAPTDLVLGYENPSRPLVLDSRKALERYLGGSPTDRPEAYAAASAIHFVGANTPPTLLIHGSLDPIVWPLQSEVLAARLQQAGRPHLYLRLPWATHGCDAIPNGPSGQLSLYAIERFLAAVFAAPPAFPDAPAQP